MMFYKLNEFWLVAESISHVIKDDGKARLLWKFLEEKLERARWIIDPAFGVTFRDVLAAIISLHGNTIFANTLSNWVVRKYHHIRDVFTSAGFHLAVHGKFETFKE
jgi:hypothetical protein